ncbi:hypothetical protein DYP60_04065 [Sphaerochaeta halotolerans]|uniref:Uncharacterized protein n=1 Tax=Sphaerochaeta halotolerans TaxID=2293840 RepID=A0A372MIN3_9SPIR|nr:hypothetical protein DYP60_04065 [Sphaerochaeta halotolerans]
MVSGYVHHCCMFLMSTRLLCFRALKDHGVAYCPSRVLPKNNSNSLLMNYLGAHSRNSCKQRTSAQGGQKEYWINAILTKVAVPLVD